MKKKGFVFLETIAVLTVVSLALCMFLATYSLIVRKTNEKDFYNNASDKYLLYSILNLGTDNNNSYQKILLPCKGMPNKSCNYKITSSNKTKSLINSNIKDEDSVANNVLESIYGPMSNGVKNKIFTDFNIYSLYLVNDVDNALKDKKSISFFDNGTIEFMKTLEKYRYSKKENVENTPISYLVGVFYRNNNYYFAAVEV